MENLLCTILATISLIVTADTLVTAVIRELIYSKFKIAGYDSVKLTLEAHSLGYHLYIPLDYA